MTKRKPKTPDLRVLWYTAPADGPYWHPADIVGNDVDVERLRDKLRRKFRGRGGVETRLKEYIEVNNDD